MNKISIHYGKKLEAALKNDPEFRDTKILEFALNLVNFITVMSTTGRLPVKNFPTLACDSHLTGDLTPRPIRLSRLFHAYRKTTRIAVDLETGIVDACIGVKIYFYSSGKNAPYLVMFKASVDSQAVRRLTTHFC